MTYYEKLAGFNEADCLTCRKKTNLEYALICYSAINHYKSIECDLKQGIPPAHWQQLLYRQLVQRLNCEPLVTRIIPM
jgi:hypothetical protein